MLETLKAMPRETVNQSHSHCHNRCPSLKHPRCLFLDGESMSMVINQTRSYSYLTAVFDRFIILLGKRDSVAMVTNIGGCNSRIPYGWVVNVGSTDGYPMTVAVSHRRGHRNIPS